MESSLQTLEISDSWLTYVPRGINKIGKTDVHCTLYTVHCTGVYIVIKHEKKFVYFLTPLKNMNNE